MAGIVDIVHDPDNKRIVTHSEDCGIQFRSNAIEKGGRIELHEHHYDHVALCLKGCFEATDIGPEGEQKYLIASKEYMDAHPDTKTIGAQVMIQAWHKHSFVLIDGECGEILCLWPDK